MNAESRIKKTIPLSKNKKKYVGTNLRKHIQDFYTGDYSVDEIN